MIAKNKFLTVDRDLRRLASEIDDFTVVCFFFFFHGLSINRRYSKRYSIDRQRADTRTLISFFSPFLSLAKIDRWKSIKTNFRVVTSTPRGIWLRTKLALSQFDVRDNT